MCPFNFPASYYWNGKKRTSPGRPPKWVKQLLMTSGAGDKHNEDVSIDQHDQDPLDENDCMDVAQEEAVIPVQCDVPTLTSSQPLQRTGTRVIRPPARYS